MPRDDLTAHGSRPFKDYGILPDGTKELWFQGTTGHYTLDTIRDDSHPTIPIGRTFVYPSIYWNYGLHLQSHSFDYYLDSSQTPYHQYEKHRIIGESGSDFWPLPWHSYGCGPTRPHLPEVASWVISAAESDCLNKMKQQDFNAGVFLAELPETVGFIAGAAEGMVAAFKEWQQLHRAAVSRKATQKELANLWLAFTLGIQPLASDIYDAAVRCVEGFNVPLFAIARVERLDPEHGPKFLGPEAYLPWGMGSYFWKLEDHSTCKRGVNIELAYKVLNPTLYALDSFGILNPLPLLWEATPYSFVIDYFIGIGNFLNAMQAPIGIELVYGYRTSWLKNDYDVTYLPKGYDANLGGTYPRVTGTLETWQRYVYPDFPLPFPALHLPVSVKKIANMIALLVQSG